MYFHLFLPLLRECGGTIQTFQVLNNGISKSVFYAYVKERGLEQASHGVYVSPDTWTDAMYLLHLRCGQAVFSHETALFFHDLTCAGAGEERREPHQGRGPSGRY